MIMNVKYRAVQSKDFFFLSSHCESERAVGSQDAGGETKQTTLSQPKKGLACQVRS